MAKRAKTNGHGQVGHNSGSIWLTRVYDAVNRDPEIDRFQKIWESNKLKESELAVLSGLSSGTVTKMFGGVTRQPRHSTFGKMAAAMGYKYDLVKDRETNYEEELPKARAEFKMHKEAMAKRKNRKRK